MDSLGFKKYITATLKPYGFRRTGKNWGAVKDGLLTVVTIDKYPYANGWFVECGAMLMAEQPGKYPEAGLLDVCEDFLFPADPSYKPEAYKTARKMYKESCNGRPISPYSPDRWVVTQYIDLDLFSDEEIDAAFRFNLEKRVLPMLNIETLKAKVQSDVFYVKTSWNPQNLPKYGIPEDVIRANNARFR